MQNGMNFSNVIGRNMDSANVKLISDDNEMVWMKEGQK